MRDLGQHSGLQAKSARRWLRGMAVCWLAAFASCCADSLFYRPGSGLVASPDRRGVSAEQVYFATPDGVLLHGWWLPAVGASKGTVVYCHGNRGNLDQHVDWVKWLPAHGFQVLLFDYRGYGNSEGSPSRAGTITDAIAAMDLALARDPERVVVYGHSLGGAIAINAVAARPQVRGLVAESTFASYRAAARGRVAVLGWLLQFLVSSGDDPEDVLASLPPRPLLVVHGDEDGIVPLATGLALFERALPPKTLYVVAGSGHRTPWVREGVAFEQRLVSFFCRAIAASAQQ